MYDISTNSWILDKEMVRLSEEKKAGVELQKRKHEDWNDNYSLYRNKVQTNRLTQRQAVNIPLMKETVKTLLSKIDETPEVDWKEISGDEQKELIYQEIWNTQLKNTNLEIVDIIDKKNVLLYGTSIKKLNIGDEGVEGSVLDPFDVVLDPLMNPWDLDSARFIIHQNIFKSIRDILADEKYTKEGKGNLKIWADTSPGITQGQDNKEQWEKKMERMRAMGIENSDFPYFAGGDRIINLTEHFTRVWDIKKKEFIKRVVVYADDKIELYNETLDKAIGVDFWPFIRWSEDPETVDIYPDSIADTIRTPNKVLNVWISQLIENRTLKNFQMHWYSSSGNYTPQTYTPGPGVMIPAPPGDDINKVIRPVEISGLEDTLEAINSITMIAERATGATAIEKGMAEKGVQTLGEVQILTGKATERTIAMAKFYRLAWYEYAWKWSELMHANAPKIIKLYKIARSGKIYPKTILQNEWKSAEGYEPIIHSSSEQELDNTKSIQKFMFILGQFPNNIALRTIAQKRMLEIVDLTPEELRQVEEGEKQAQQMLQQSQQGQPQVQPAEQPNMQNVEQLVGQLTA